jgi:hypothetical protein
VNINIPPPQLQVDFALALEQIRATYLQGALSAAVAQLDVETIDSELARFSPKRSLSDLAGHGLRGELMFAVPCILSKNPRLLGYYRLLLGFSQKAFYGFPGVSQFRSMEISGKLSPVQKNALPPLCRSLAAASAALLDGVGIRRISREVLDDLALLTVGPQLRGGYNVRAGTAGIVRVFEGISTIVSHATVKTEPQLIELKNAAGRRVLIQFASDPDIRIQEEVTPGSLRNIIAIEVKAGVDFSNITTVSGKQKRVTRRQKRTDMSSDGQSSTLTGWI